MSWQLDCGRASGRHVRLSFLTKDDAESEMSRRKSELKQHGSSVLDLSAAERMALQSSRERLGAVNATLDEAVSFFLQHARPSKSPVTFDGMLKLCLLARKEAGLSARYLPQLKSVGTQFVLAGYGATLAHEIGTEQMHAWLRSNQWQWKTWNNYRAALLSIFKWGAEEGYLTLNPCLKVPIRKPRADEIEEIRFIQVADVEKLFRRAALPFPTTTERRRSGRGCFETVAIEEENFQDFIPLLAIGFFCGLRPERELGEMDDARDVRLAD